MADNLNIDLKDNDGGFNCGKPAGYIKDFKALPEKTQELIKQIKRVRVVLGTVEMKDPVDESGNAEDIGSTPFLKYNYSRTLINIQGTFSIPLIYGHSF